VAQKISHRSVGSLWLAQATFTISGTPTDPTNLTVRTQNAAGTESVLLNNVLVSTLTGSTTPVKKVSTGVFQLNPGVTLDASGYWFCKFEGAGAVTATIQDEIIVDPDEFTSNAGVSLRALVGLPETKYWLKQQNLSVTNDIEVVNAINDVSDRIHQEAGREFKPITAGAGVVRLFDVDSLAVNRRQVFVGDLASAPTLVRVLDKDGVALATVASGDYTLLPRVREAWEPIQRLRFSSDVTQLVEESSVEITGTWGFPAVPGNLRQATLDAVAYILDRDVEHYRQDLEAMTGGGVTLMLALPPSTLEAVAVYKTPTYG
jgi:hypothetical protein